MNMNTKKSATIHTTNDPRPKRPAVDSGEEFETVVRAMFAPKVDKWCQANCEADSMPDKEARASVVDNLVASFSSAFETMTDAAVDSYLSTVSGDDEIDVLKCPHCEKEIIVVDDLGEGDEEFSVDIGDEIECPHCEEKFEVNEDTIVEDEDDGGGDGGGEPAPAPKEEEPRRRRRSG